MFMKIDECAPCAVDAAALCDFCGPCEVRDEAKPTQAEWARRLAANQTAAVVP